MSVSFTISATERPEQRQLLYLSWEYSLLMEPSEMMVDRGLILNHLTLTVMDGRVKLVDGYFSALGWIRSELMPPQAVKGALIVDTTGVPDHDLALNDEHWPVHYDPASGWTCTGIADARGQGVEFILSQGIAVIDERGALLSLWLKPTILNDPSEMPVPERGLGTEIERFLTWCGLGRAEYRNGAAPRAGAVPGPGWERTYPGREALRTAFFSELSLGRKSSAEDLAIAIAIDAETGSFFDGAMSTLEIAQAHSLMEHLLAMHTPSVGYMVVMSLSEQHIIVMQDLLGRYATEGHDPKVVSAILRRLKR